MAKNFNIMNSKEVILFLMIGLHVLSSLGSNTSSTSKFVLRGILMLLILHGQPYKGQAKSYLISKLNFITFYSEVCPDHFEQLDEPSSVMSEKLCEAQCMINCHTTKGTQKLSIILRHDYEKKISSPHFVWITPSCYYRLQCIKMWRWYKMYHRGISFRVCKWQHQMQRWHQSKQNVGFVWIPFSSNWEKL